jgi:hypothetical protein
VLVLEESLGDVVWHVKIDHAFDVVPRWFDFAEEGTCPIDSNGVVFLEGCNKMFHVGHACCFDAKVVDDEAIGDVTPHVMP